MQTPPPLSSLIAALNGETAASDLTPDAKELQEEALYTVIDATEEWDRGYLILDALTAGELHTDTATLVRCFRFVAKAYRVEFLIELADTQLIAPPMLRMVLAECWPHLTLPRGGMMRRDLCALLARIGVISDRPDLPRPDHPLTLYAARASTLRWTLSRETALWEAEANRRSERVPHRIITALCPSEEVLGIFYGQRGIEVVADPTTLIDLRAVSPLDAYAAD